MRASLKGLTKRFGKTRALKNVSLELEEGKIYGLLGLNGAGKTTLLRALSGVVAPTEGVIMYDGAEFAPGNIDLRRRLMFLPDFPLAFPDMTPIQHIGMVLNVYERPVDGIEQKAMELMEEFNILKLANVPMETFSRGEAYKTVLTTLLLVNPDLMLLDEPFASGIDPIALKVMKRRLRRAADDGRTVIYSTQIVEVNKDFADEIILLDDGELAAFDTLKKLGDPANTAVSDVIRQLLQDSSHTEMK